jgi:hypothetical protein
MLSRAAKIAYDTIRIAKAGRAIFVERIKRAEHNLIPPLSELAELRDGG